MNLTAKIIAALIFFEGLISLLFPSRAQEASREFNDSSSSFKRMTGAFAVAAGAILLYISRRLLGELLAHWVVSAGGIYMLLVGLFMVGAPSYAGRAVNWFYREKRVTSFIGFLLLLAGLVLYLIL